MPIRLSDLLDRIRPAGTPGAPNESEGAPDKSDRDADLEPIIRMITAFEQEGADLVAAARRTTEQGSRDAKRRIRQINDQHADKLAVARTDTTQQRQELSATEQRRIVQAADAHITRLNVDAPELTMQVVEMALTFIMSTGPFPLHDATR